MIYIVTYIYINNINSQSITLLSFFLSLRLRRDAANSTSTFDKEDVGWTNINAEVDMVTVMVLEHLQKLGIEHLQLPDMKESISVVI